MKYFTKIALILPAFIVAEPLVQAQDEWRENMELLIYSPRYFGPNAFPVPELRSGRIDTRWELEVRGEYHDYKGDQTKDLFARLFIPIAHGRAGVEMSGVIREDYKMTPETVAERYAVGTESPIGTHGDFIISSFYQILKSDKWCDVVIDVSLKTASGNRLCDARYTDAAAYWFNLTAGRNLYQNPENNASVRLQGMAGFYCWETNDLIHRQNDAFLYGIGISGSLKNLSLAADYTGFQGYNDNGDRPTSLRTKINYEYKKNILSFRFRHGITDFLYNSYSIAYIRCF
ncbi:MAG: hypothetical protein LBN71_08620 [Tannerella sp.]|jgi:hypothetical protein|nr:hypothetical protein [Tannerella sp.]